MTLNEVMTQTADAIREKTGKSEKIAPVNFAEEIKSISAGGGESGGSSWRYFDTTKTTVTEDNLPIFGILLSLFKIKFEDNTRSIMHITPTLDEWRDKFVVAMATDFNQKISFPSLTGIGVLKTIEEVFNDMGGVESFKEAFGLTEITKEQFYSLD